MNFFQKRLVIALIIVFAAGLPYSNIFSNQFAYDDTDFFVRWDGVKSLENIPAFFNGNLPVLHQHTYRPVRSIVQAMVYSVSGENPLGYHIFSIIIHLLATVLVYLLARKFFHEKVALLSAVIFGVLPVHTSAVTFMTASFDLIGIVFVLLSLYLYVLFREKDKKVLLWFSIGSALVGFFSYEIALILPLLIVLYDSCIRSEDVQRLKKNIHHYLFFFAGVIAWIIVKYGIVGDAYKGALFQDIAFVPRMLTMLKATMVYMYVVIINYPLRVFYDITISHTISELATLISFLVIAAMLILSVFLYKKKKRALTFIILWFFISILPVANIVQTSRFISEGYVYLASVSWAFLVGYAVIKLLEYADRKQVKALKAAVIILFLALANGYATLSIIRNVDWRSDKTLWAREIELSPDFASPYVGLALYFRNQEDYNKAIEYEKIAIEINPDFFLAHQNLGDIYVEQGLLEEAIPYMTKAVELAPGYLVTVHNLGLVYQELGNYEKAKQYYKDALDIYADNYETIYNLGIIHGRLAEYDESIEYFNRAIDLRKNDPRGYLGLGIAYQEMGDSNQAIRYYQETLKVDPANAAAKTLLMQLSQ